MRIRTLEQRQRDKVTKLKEWHDYFIICPRRIGSHWYFLCTVRRRLEYRDPGIRVYWKEPEAAPCTRGRGQ